MATKARYTSIMWRFLIKPNSIVYSFSGNLYLRLYAKTLSTVSAVIAVEVSSVMIIKTLKSDIWLEVKLS